MGNFWNEETKETDENLPEKVFDPEDLNSDDWSFISKITNYKILDSCICRVVVNF
jgi:hypothetical protein